ncbi:hypothetical protein BJ165DRAFT_1304593, partial [Panaeolus papilionaceus]
NTPIERLWVELGRRFCRAWRVFFLRLARLHNLVQDNPVHRWLLQYLFLEMINKDCKSFVEEWNAHPMRNRNNKSPNVINFTSTLSSFTFTDECEGLREEDIEMYYQYPRERAEGEEGDVDVKIDEVDFSEDEAEDDDLHEVDPAADVDPNIHHEAVDVPDGRCPFTKDQLATFKIFIEEIHQEGQLPHGYGVQPDEWEDGVYSEVEELPIGHAQRTKLIHLPNCVWQARSVLWAQALCLLETSEV